MNVWKEALRDDLLTVVLTKIACQRISWYLSRNQPAEDLISMFWRMASIALQRYQRCHWAETSIGSYLYIVFLNLHLYCLIVSWLRLVDLLICYVLYIMLSTASIICTPTKCNVTIYKIIKWNKYIITIYSQL